MEFEMVAVVKVVVRGWSFGVFRAQRAPRGPLPQSVAGLRDAATRIVKQLPHFPMGTWCIGISSASHAEGLGPIPSAPTRRPRNARCLWGATTRATPPENTRSARAPAMSLARLLAHGDAQRLNFSAQRCQRAQGRQHDVRLRDAYEGIRHEPAVVREGLPRPVSQIKKNHRRNTQRAPPHNTGRFAARTSVV